MQATELSSFMENAVIEVLEAMCFIASEGTATENNEQSPPDWVCGELDFIGETSGRFGIAVPPTTAATITANFLGEAESDLTNKDTSEVICELANMVCGTLLAQMNSKDIFTLSPPRPVSGNIRNTNYMRIKQTYTIDEGCIHAWLEYGMVP